MSTKKNVVLSGVLALVIAIALLGAITYSISQQGASSTLTNSISSVSSTTAAAAPGTLSVLLTDPPNVPDGVTAVTVTYTNLAVHVSEAGNQSGWTSVKDSGTIELLSTVNVAQTLSSVKIQSGDYNMIRFNISSAQITYNGKNYPASVPSSELKVPIIGGIKVDNSKASATMIDISPTVFNVGSTSNPDFVIRPVAKAFPVPSSELSEQTQHEGARMSLEGKAWWKSIQQQYTANLQITAASLTANSLSVTAKNTGQQTDTLRLVTVSPIAATLAGSQHHIPNLFFDSSIFVIQKDGTIVTIQTFLQNNPSLLPDQHALVGKLLEQIGYNVASGASATFTYSGQITLGFAPLKAEHAVVSGQQYLITVLGDQALASMVVVAG